MTRRGDLIAGILEQIAQIGRELTAARQSPFGDAHLSKTQLDALFILAHSPAPVTAGALAAALTVTPGAVTQLAAGLREHDLVETFAQPGDGRVRIIQLTPGAREQVDAFERDAVARLAPAFAALDIDELTQLSRLLRKRERTMSAVFVTGATGIVGSAVVEHLLERGQQVIAAVRDTGDTARLPAGAEPRVFEFGASPAELDAALDGADRLFLMRPPPIEDVRTYLFPVIDAARRRGIRQIVFLSLQGVQANRKTPHHAVEQYLRETGAPYTFLRPNFFMQNLSSTYRDDIRERSIISVPAGHARTAFIDARDIGRVAAAVFTRPGHLRKAYTLSGEQTLGYNKVAQIMTEVLGREIHYERPSEADYLARLAREGKPADYIAVQKMIYRVVRLNVSALPNRKVRTLTGQPATPFSQFVQNYRDIWS